MGTSSNQASPNTPGWDLVRALLGREGVPPNRQATEIWRAAIGERGDLFIGDLSSPLIAGACRLASEANSPQTAVDEFESLVLRSREASLALDLCKRALARTVAAGTGSEGFGAELFAEVTSYYASRDLPSFTAVPGRVRTVAEAIRLKRDLRTFAADVAKSTGPVRSDPEGWRDYTTRVVNTLQGRK